MRRRLWIIILAALALFAGCERRPLENMYSTTVKVVVKCLWTVEAYPDGIKPSGVTMYFFRNGEFHSTLTTANVDSCTVQLPEGHYRMYMISQSPEEYWKMEFDHMTSFTDASMSLRRSNVTWATRVGDEEVVENPEVIYAGVSDEFDITSKMAEDYQYYYSNLKKLMSSGRNTKAGDDDEITFYEEKVEYYTVRIPVYPKNVVSQLWITIFSDNADVLKSVRASTSGMARTFELTQGVTNKDEAIQVLSDWKLTMDDPVRRVGHVDGIITTFGLPNGEVPSAVRDSSLNVSALLVDDTTVANYKFNVGDKIRILPPNEGYRSLYRLVFGSVSEPAIKPPDVKPSGGGGGFTAAVSDWEDEIETEILL